jgi:hypothetical protein
MTLPSWWAEAELKKQKRLEAVHAQQPNVSYGLNEKGWHLVTSEISCIPDPMYPPDRDVVKAIRARWPDLIPVWLRWVYVNKDDGETRIIGRHGLARHVDNPHYEHERLDALMPTGERIPTPTLVEVMFEGKRDLKTMFPGEYVPFDWLIYKYVEEHYATKSGKELKAELKAEHEEKAEQRQKAAEEQEYIQRDLDKFADKILDTISEVEMKEWALRDHKPEKKKIQIALLSN